MTKAFVLAVVIGFAFAGCAAEDQSETTAGATGGTSDVGSVESGVGSGASATGAAAASIGKPGH
ncbi:MAG: hypothetical protein ACREP1_08675 [Rhodanobacteraceae bacterium]